MYVRTKGFGFNYGLGGVEVTKSSGALQERAA